MLLPRRFLLFALIMILNNQTAISIFRAVAAIFRAVVFSNMMVRSCVCAQA